MHAAVLIGLFAAICFSQLHMGLRAVAHLDGFWDDDMCRDAAIAQLFTDGQPDADSAYLGERQWYNPLVPAAMSIASQAMHIPIHALYAKGGAYINLVILLAAFGLVSRLCNLRVALATVLGMAFVVQFSAGSYPYQLHTYQPIMFTTMLGQVFLYVGWWLVWKRLGNRWTVWTAMGLGAWLGLTFLAHTAAAIQLGMLLCIAMLFPAWIEPIQPAGVARPAMAQGAALLALALTVALVVNWPLTKNILFHYHLQIKNPLPSSWTGHPASLQNLSSLLRSCLQPGSLVTLVGAWCLIVRPYRTSRLARLVITWVEIALGWILLGYLSQAINAYAGRTTVLVPLPTIHFLITLKFIEALLFGYGLVALCNVLTDRLRPWLSARWVKAKDGALSGISLALLVCSVSITACMLYPRQQWALKHYLQSPPNVAEEMPVYDFLRLHASPSIVVLARPAIALCH
ncbi:MAG TPA: hypothetical protein VGC24_11775, partial [Burkholderiaceae bacterium]